MMESSICPAHASRQEYEPVTVSIIFYVLINCYYLVILLSPTANGISQGKSAAAKIFHIIDRKPTISSNDDSAKLDDIRGEIEFLGVTFAYPKDKSKIVLDHVSMKFNVKDNTTIMG